MAEDRVDIYSRIKELPDSPGVYMFLDARAGIIYIGKARRLRRRVASYFRAGRGRGSRMELLVSEARDVRIIRTSSEAEALIYEAGLIKHHRPRFNVELKDDKSYPFLKLTVNEEYPRFFVTRKKLSDGALYYGPYVNVGLLKEAVSFMKRVFPLRSCRRLRKKVCLEFHIGQCAGPCEGRVSSGDYRKIVGQLRAFLEGRRADLIGSIEKDMKRSARKKEYERALSAKKRIEALTAVQQLHDRSRHPMYGELEELQNALGLPDPPVTIECFDISNIGGRQAVGAMVRFVDGRPQKAGYRKFRIRGVYGIDDYSMIREVVRRRYSRLLKEGKELPGLVLIDGGRGHLFSAKKELGLLGLGSVPVAGIAKEFNHLYTEARKLPIRLSPGSRLLLLIQRVRDEAHRFAITYHRKLRKAGAFETGLKHIKGVGPVREQKLLDKFGSPDNVGKASFRELRDAGMDASTARAITRWGQTSSKHVK